MKKSDSDFSRVEDLSEAEFEGIDEATGELTREIEEKMHREIISSHIKYLDTMPGIRSNGYMDLTVSGDGMTATADFYPPVREGEPITVEQVLSQLAEKHIVYGVREGNIKEAVRQCTLNNTEVRDVVIAEGTPAVDEIPEHCVIEEALLSGKKMPKQGPGLKRVNFKEISPFVLVSKGQVLARRVPGTEGQFGYNVFGKALDFRVKKIIPLEPGENTVEEENVCRAACDGKFEYDREGFRVNDILTIRSNVDYTTGNIDFPGDVVINGEIKDGFTVKAGRSIMCKKTLDASEVTCGGDLVIKNGIIGRKKSIIKVEGSVQAKFIENCYIEAGNTISINTSIIHSVVNTRDAAVLGEKGCIYGGRLFAQNGISAYQIGNESGVKTELYCGIDYAVQQKLEWIREKNIDLVFQFSQIEQKGSRGEIDEETLTVLQEKIRKALDKLNEAAKTLIPRLDKNENAQIEITGTVFPDTYIEICHMKYVVTRPLKRVVFKLDKTRGRVVYGQA